MANQIIVTSNNTVQVSVTPTPTIQANISRAAINAVTSVPNANYANFAGNVVNANQPNITAVGTLTNLNISGNLSVGGNVTIGNLVANTANYANFAGQAFNVNVANVNGIGNISVLNLNGNANTILDGTGNFVALPSTANANFANFAGTAYSVSGANVSGSVANANYATNAGNSNIANIAYSVSASNVTGLGNIATINLDGNVSNILHGDGSFGPEAGNLNANYANFAGEAFLVSGGNVSGSVANANYSNFAGTAYSVNGANVSGSVANANYSNFSGTAYSVAGANVSGSVANANYANIAGTAYSVSAANVTGLGNIATINLNGNGSQALLGNGTFGLTSQIANVNSNVNIISANGAITFNPNAIANAVVIESTGFSNYNPAASINHVLRFNTFGRNNNFAQTNQLSWFKARGNSTTPLSVQPNDLLSQIGSFGHNGAAYQTNSFAYIRGVVDSSYTANAANIPIGWTILVNDTNGGINNQSRTHSFFANGVVTFNRDINVPGNISATGNITGNYILGNGSQLTGISTTAAGSNTQVQFNNNNAFGASANFTYNSGTNLLTVANGSFTLSNPNTSPGAISAANSSIAVTMDNVNTGNPSFAFTTYTPGSIVNPYTFFRGRGNQSSPSPIQGGDAITSWGFYTYADSGNTYKSTAAINVVALDNDLAGNVSAAIQLDATSGGPNSRVDLLANSQIILNTKSVSSNGNLYIANTFYSTLDNNQTQAIFQKTYNNSNLQTGQWTSFRARGTQGTPLAVANGDYIGKFTYVAYADSGNTFQELAQQLCFVDTNYGNGNVITGFRTRTFGTNDYVEFYTPQVKFTNDGTTNASIYGNGYASFKNANLGNLATANYFSGNGYYLTGLQSNAIVATYGAFYNPNSISLSANTVYSLALPNTSGNSGVYIANTSQMHVPVAGTYNIQFSIQVKNTDNAADHDIDIWFAKNGTDIPASASQWTVVKNDGKNICVVNLVDTCTANSYYEIKYAANSANISLEAFSNISTPYSRPSIPSAIVTIVPVGS